MKLIKKIISAAAAAVMMFTGTLVCGIPGTEVKVSAADYTAPYTGGNDEAYKVILKALRNMDEKISLSKYNLSYQEYDEILGHILMNYPEIFYIKPETDYTYYKKTNNIINVYPIYYYSEESIKSRKKKLDAAVDDIIKGVNSSWSDVQKALYVHERIALGCVYSEDNDIRSAYEALVVGDGVCVAYAMAYKLVLDKLGIGCLLVLSEEMNHCWNMVEIDGKWYHVDVTWDDVYPDLQGQVYHDFFLCSDTDIKNGSSPHKGWEYGKKASSDKYDKAFWRNSASQVIPENSRYSYYIDSERNCLYRYDWKNGSKTKVTTVPEEWKMWSYNFSRLMCADGIYYYSTANSVYSYDPETGKKTRLKKYNLSGNSAIYGLYIDDGHIMVQIGNGPNKVPSKTRTVGKAGAASKLIAPESFKGSTKGSSVTLTWDKVSGADGYTVYYYNSSKGTIIEAGSVKTNKFTDSGLKKGKYQYKVRAYVLVNGSKVYGDLSSVVSKSIK